MQPIIHALRSPIIPVALAITAITLAFVIALRPPPATVVTVPISITTAAPAASATPTPLTITMPYYVPAPCYTNVCPHLTATSRGYVWSFENYPAWIRVTYRRCARGSVVAWP